jgi:hypothetical protein
MITPTAVFVPVFCAAVNEGGRFAPDAPKPIAVLLLFHVYVTPTAGVLVTTGEGTVAPGQ